MSSNISKKIILTKTADGNLGMHFVQAKTVNLKIGDLVNLDITPKSIPLEEPEPPTLRLDPAPTERKIQHQKNRLFNYKIDLLKYQYQQISLAEIIIHIQNTISTNVAVYLRDAGPEAYDMLFTLKSNIASSTQGRLRDIELEHQCLPNY